VYVCVCVCVYNSSTNGRSAMCNEFSFFITLIVNNNFTSSVWANLYPTIDMFYRYVDKVVTATDDYYEGVRGNVCVMYVCVLPVCAYCVCVFDLCRLQCDDVQCCVPADE
jgi:hypothetical protein